jgi:hypothetical protein
MKIFSNDWEYRGSCTITGVTLGQAGQSIIDVDHLPVGITPEDIMVLDHDDQTIPSQKSPKGSA